jgi:hypothetical protein
MSNVNADGIVTPDEGNTLDPEVWSAAMADSISEGIGTRVTAQEQAIGLKAGIAPLTRVKFENDLIAPFEITGSNGSFVQGMELNGGIAEVSVAGMYFITAAASLNMWGGVGGSPENENRTIAVQLKHNGGDLAGAEVTADENYWQTAQANCVTLCAPGDTLHVNWYSAATTGDNPDPTAGAMIASNNALQSLSIVLVTPVAV